MLILIYKFVYINLHMLLNMEGTQVAQLNKIAKSAKTGFEISKN